MDATAYSHGGFERALASLDIILFDHFRSQTALRDRLSLLALHNACRDLYGTFRYLEIGSYLGGSLQALIRDPRCVEIVSIDARADVARDDLKGEVTYEDNTTAFHDRAVVRPAIDEFLADLPPGGHSPLALRGGIRIVETGEPRLIPRVEALLRPS